jgi:hypothetical protein
MNEKAIIIGIIIWALAFVGTMIGMYITKDRENRKPKVGDRVKVAVGFSSYEHEGVVASVYPDYCWIDQFNNKGKYIRSFTASFSYCNFKFL